MLIKHELRFFGSYPIYLGLFRDGFPLETVPGTQQAHFSPGTFSINIGAVVNGHPGNVISRACPPDDVTGLVYRFRTGPGSTGLTPADVDMTGFKPKRIHSSRVEI